MWQVEFNFAGCRINRWAEKRRHLIAPDPRSFTSRERKPVVPVRAAS